jgi:hypothetical protein
VYLQEKQGRRKRRVAETTRGRDTIGNGRVRRIAVWIDSEI